MCPLGYYMIIRQSKDPKLFRYQLVRYAEKHGVKPAARAFKTTPKTVRKWLNRWQPGSLRGLDDQSKAPKSRHSKISPYQRQKAIKLKKQLKSWGAERIKREFDLAISAKAIRKIWHEQGLLKKKRRKHKTKNDLRAVKAKWRVFEQIDIDTKALYDIPEYWPQMRRLGLPRYQYTARDVVSGLMFTGYAQENNLSNATLFIQTLIQHLRECGVKLEGCRIQTDNGSEFIGAWSTKKISAFTETVEAVPGLKHHTIPPGAHTYQADVETVHRLIEDEFFEVESFLSLKHFYAKANAYNLWFNVGRKNSYKKYQTPWDIIYQRHPNANPNLARLPAIYLDELWKIKLAKPNQRGYHLIPYPFF
jgi:transposase